MALHLILRNLKIFISEKNSERRKLLTRFNYKNTILTFKIRNDDFKKDLNAKNVDFIVQKLRLRPQNGFKQKLTISEFETL